MKKLFALCLATALSVFSFATINPRTIVNYHNGQSLTIVALSGLTLRDAPDVNSKVLMIMEYGDDVMVLNDSISKSSFDRIDWLEGQWVFVEYRGIQGYAFDGYLSSLPLPYFGFDEGTCEDLPIMIEDYMTNLSYNGVVASADSGYVSALMEKEHFGITRSFPGEHYMSCVRADDYTQVQLTLHQVRFPEVFNLMLNFLDYCEDKEEVVARLIFVKDEQGAIREVRTIGDDRLKITRIDNETVLVKMTTPCS